MRKSEDMERTDAILKCAEIRERIINIVSKNGGHLSSSLGAVEIAVALSYVFDPMSDKIVWDVGHQAYAWKLLTAREKSFDTLRRLDGIAPFPTPLESPADAAVAGHAGVSLSVAFGMAIARDRFAGAENVVAVVGDSALANGMSLEALNSYSLLLTKAIVVLNDNDVSVVNSPQAASTFLSKSLLALKSNDEKNLKAHFESLGFKYIGPIDGHDVNALISAFALAKEENRGVFVHVVTKKGYGFAPSEENPSKWHSVDAFSLSSVCAAKSLSEMTDGGTWSSHFGRIICEKAKINPNITAITAGMADGTGLSQFAKKFPSRFFDVGIAEGHMIGFAAGLASHGMRPVVCVYSSFLQRAIDQIMHDVAISSLPVIIAVDRAGCVGPDGMTHQGLYDYAMLKCLPNLVICQPRDAADLDSLIDEALKRNGPTLIRYPRGKCPSVLPLQENAGKVAIWATGDWYGKACEVASRIGAIVVHARYLKPFDEKLLISQRKKGMLIVSLENGSIAGGFGETLGSDLKFGWPDVFIEHGALPELEKKYKLDVDSIAEVIEEHLKNKESL